MVDNVNPYNYRFSANLAVFDAIDDILRTA